MNDSGIAVLKQPTVRLVGFKTTLLVLLFHCTTASLPNAPETACSELQLQPLNNKYTRSERLLHR